MDLKNYLLLKERAYFVDLATLSDEIINQLQEKLAKKKTIRSGDTITVSIGDMYDLDIKLYKGYSRAAREADLHKGFGEDDKTKSASAAYFPETADSNGRIEVYVNSSKKGQSYYKERKFEDFINKSLPKYIKDILRHEIAHAYENIISDVARFKDAPHKNRDEYINSDEEVNAYFMQWFPGELKNNKMAQHYMLLAHNSPDPKQKTENISNAYKTLYRTLATQPWVKELSEDNKRWILKTLYTSITDMIDKIAK